jgi:two-component system, OmpR family, KDP operon response regulator KdpE
LASRPEIAETRVSCSIRGRQQLFGIGQVRPSSSAHSKGTRISRRGTTVLVLTSDAGLIRLARSILEPTCRVTGRAPLGPSTNIRAEQADIVIIDAESVDHDVIATAKRACPDAQVIALSRKLSEADRIAILDSDADYLARPFRAHDLAARVRVAALRRFNATGRPRTYHKGLLVFDLFDCRLAIDGRPVALTPSELAILSLLAAQPGAVVEYKWILTELGLDGSERSRGALRSHVLRLRRKIERDSLHPEILLAEAGVGYRLAVLSEEPPHRARDSLPPDEERSELL